MAPAIARRRAGLLLVLALGLAEGAHALEPDRALTQYVRQDWRAPHALPHDNVTAILQTGDGYLWVGTVEGLARFDGVRSVVFDKSTTPALGDNWIRALVEDRAGRLWIATYGGGLACLEQGRFRRYGEAEGLPGDVLLTLHEDRGGRVWVGAHDGLYRLVGERFVRETSAGAPRTAVHAILDDRSGTLWIGTVDGLYRRGAEGWQRQAGLNNEVVLALAETDEGLWIGTENGGLNHFGDGRMSALTPAEGLAHPRVWALAADRTGSLWIGTDGGGLQRLHRRRLETLSTANGLPSDSVWALAEDREGGFWVGTSGGGLLRLGAGPVLPWTTREGLPTDFVWGVLRTRSGELYAGTEGKGLLRLGGERVESFPVHEPGPGTAKVLLERRDGSLWIGRHHGLAVWRDGRVVGVPAGALDDDTINDLAEDPDGTLWIASNSSGLWALDAGGARRVEDFPGLGTDSVNALLVARDGALWAATLDGVLRRRGDEIDVWTRKHGLPSSYVTDLVEGPDGAVWAATRGGLARIRYGRVDVPGARQGFDDAVKSMRLDRSGFLWLGGNRGLLRVEVRQLEEALERTRERAEPFRLGLDDGLPSIEVNGAGSSSFEDRDGRLWFATRGGLAVIDPTRLVAASEPPPVRIEEALADGARLPGHGNWTLEPGVRRLELHFTALSFTSIRKMRIRHRLEGFDPDWVDARPDRTAEYTNLAHGRYRFHVVAANSDGVWNLVGDEVAFEILPRLSERLWFRAMLVVVFALLGPLFYLVRVWQLRSQKRELERQVATRTAEVEAANVALSQLAREDPLTRLANRRSFDEALDEEWRRALRLNSPLALLMIDVDAFKAYNDDAGHLAGDACLQAVAQALDRAFQRAGERVARYGGEEFAALLPTLNRDQALRAAESARQRIFHLGLPHRTSRVASVVTVSIGVAWTQPSAGGSPTDLVAAADRALYRAKQNGRNRVESDPVTSG